MARIRTIKPEFPQSESMGRVSRDARLLFVQLWTICDDSGRTRGASRMLASLLFPYDDDAVSLIDGWLAELEREGCLVRYEVDGSTYLQVQKWQQHQKIDKPSASKFPSPREPSRDFAEPSRKIVQDQGPRTKDQGGDQGEEAREKTRAATPTRQVWPESAVVPEGWIKSAAEQRKLAGLPEIDLRVLARMFANHYAADRANPRTVTEYQAKWNNWALKEKANERANGTAKNSTSDTIRELARMAAQADGSFEDPDIRQ